jgi:hypothetical protein
MIVDDCVFLGNISSLKVNTKTKRICTKKKKLETFRLSTSLLFSWKFGAQIYFVLQFLQQAAATEGVFLEFLTDNVICIKIILQYHLEQCPVR